MFFSLHNTASNLKKCLITHQSKVYVERGGRHSTEEALTLHAQTARVRITVAVLIESKRTVHESLIVDLAHPVLVRAVLQILG
jgi:hypothetical protein